MDHTENVSHTLALLEAERLVYKKRLKFDEKEAYIREEIVIALDKAIEIIKCFNIYLSQRNRTRKSAQA